MIDIVFMGTPEFAVPCLQSLIQEGYRIKGVVTQPDRPRGRKRELTPPPVKVCAQQHEIAVYQPESLRAADALQPIFAWQPDLIVTVAYGQILPSSLLEFPRYRCINVHASLLPQYRGGAPIQHAIINGDQETGVTIMYMEKGLDTGNMLAHARIPIDELDDNGTMHVKLSRLGADLLIRTLPLLLRGEIKAVPQVHERATIARNIGRADERIDWYQSSRAIMNRVRGLHPWPIAFTMLGEDIFKIYRVEMASLFTEAERQACPGEWIRMTNYAIVIRTGDGALAITHIQPAGKKAMNTADYLRGKHAPLGSIFE